MTDAAPVALERDDFLAAVTGHAPAMAAAEASPPRRLGAAAGVGGDDMTADVAELADGALVARCRAGDAAAWDLLVERFSRYVYAICAQGFRLPPHDAEDAFQDVFAKVYEQLPQLRDDDASDRGSRS